MNCSVLSLCVGALCSPHLSHAFGHASGAVNVDRLTAKGQAGHVQVRLRCGAFLELEARIHAAHEGLQSPSPKYHTIQSRWE